MFGAFKDRRPWAAALVNLILSPVFGMLYLNRGLYAIWYWIASIFLAIFCLSFLPAFFPASEFSSSVFLADLPLYIAGAVHAFFITRKQPWDTRLKWYAHWYSAIGVAFGLPALLALCIRTFLYQPFDIPSTAMAPSVNRGDHFFVSKRAYDNSPPQRGDIVVFFPAAFKTHFIKRIVGLPDDRIQMIRGRLFINGVKVPMRRLEDVLQDCGGSSPCMAAQYEEMFPGGKTGHILDLGPGSPLDDTAVFVVPQNSYFVLGDNRDNSDDSRESLGFVPRSAITGRVAYKYMVDGRWVWRPVP